MLGEEVGAGPITPVELAEADDPPPTATGLTNNTSVKPESSASQDQLETAL
jgi:hypothetical protein